MYCAQYANVITQAQGVYGSLVYAQCDKYMSKRLIIEVDQSYTGVTRRRTRRPTAVLIAGYNSRLIQQRQKLLKIGFNVAAAHSLLDGYTRALQLLALPKPVRPTVVLFDLLGIQPGFPELPGSLVAAVLAQHMQLREIHAAWLIGLTESHDSQCEIEALVAGCHHVRSLAFSDETLLLLQDLAARPAPIPHIDAWPDQARIIRVLQHMAVRVLHAVRDAYIETWTEEDIVQLLGSLTRYPTGRSRAKQEKAAATSVHPASAQRLVRALGGPRAARDRLRKIADDWQGRYPLHGQILHQFLDGYERREIVRSFVKQGLYEDTRIYTCIKELPQRLSEQFRLDQVIAHIG